MFRGGEFEVKTHMSEDDKYLARLAKATTRVVTYLIGREAERAIALRDLRRYVHGSTAEALLPVILGHLIAQERIEIVPADLTSRGAMLYYKDTWYTHNARGAEPASTEVE